MSTAQVTSGRDAALSRILAVYVATGLLFMLVPGTLLGVLNLVQISGRESATLVAPAWIQAHGHAQIFGWIGSFMLGIGFYSMREERGRAGPGTAWTCWALWTTGVGMRWFGNVYLAGGPVWRVLLPLSAALELAAFLLFFREVAGHRRAPSSRRADTWTWIVVAGTIGWLVTLFVNAVAVGDLALHGNSPAVPHLLDQQFLALVAWGVLAPFIWGFSARWMPVVLGLRPLRPTALGLAVAAAAAGIVLTFADAAAWAGVSFVVSAVLAIAGLRLFEPPAHAPRTRGVHHRMPTFVRLAYGWLAIAALLGLAASRYDISGGIWGASRHAFTVGFTAAMVFAVGQRMLPAFVGHRVLWSPRLMGIGLTLLMVGCALRVSSEILAYQDYSARAWSVLPLSAAIELTAVTAFAINLFWSLWAPAPDMEGANARSTAQSCSS